ncbi:MAG: hypothetical protein ACKOQ8_06675 [Micrococcales bacterium]
MAGYTNQMPTDEGIVGAKSVANLGDGVIPRAGGVVPGTFGSAPATPKDATSDYGKQWKLENDPVYQQAMAGGQSSFNMARANALANLQNQTTAANRQLSNMKQQGATNRRNLAGNFAARGMQGGARGAYYRAQDQMNAEDIAAQTDVKDQLSQLNNNFLQNFGDVNNANFDWTATTSGQDYKNQAVQQALSSILARYGAA